MSKASKGELIIAAERFDYSPLAPKTAEKVKEAAERVRQTVKRTIENIIAVGNELNTVKDALPHGQFGPWLRAEFGWTERTARNFMAVAEQFGPKTEIISDLRIDPTAAYLLAAPSAPDEARQTAVKRAEEGERITPKVAKQILAKERRKSSTRRKGSSGEKLAEKLAKVLSRFRERWNEKELAALAQQLRSFADSMKEEDATKKKKP